MKNIELISPNGKATVFAHSSKVKQMVDLGWKEKEKIKQQVKVGKSNG